MIELYTWPTPNGHKVHIMLEECGAAVHACTRSTSAPATSSSRSS